MTREKAQQIVHAAAERVVKDPVVMVRAGFSVEEVGDLAQALCVLEVESRRASQSEGMALDTVAAERRVAAFLREEVADLRRQIDDLRRAWPTQRYYVDGTPDADYPVRILESYVDESKWGDDHGYVAEVMNRAQEERNEILRRAAAVLRAARIP